jgi:tRNA(adenine34) deaminase
MRELEARWMLRALELARAGDTMFGAVLVRRGEVVAEAHNTVGLTHDPSAHAELNVIREYCGRQGVGSLSGYALYTTAEPCPMCAGLCAFVELSEVVFGVSIGELSALGVPQVALSCAEVLRRAPVPARVRGGVLHEACLEHCRALALPKG